MIKMLRDEKGRYSGRELDPRIQKSIESERECVQNALKLCELVKIKPEDLGLRKGLDGNYEITYATVQILNKAAEDKICGLVDKALDAHEDEIHLMALAKVIRA